MIRVMVVSALAAMMGVPSMAQAPQVPLFAFASPDAAARWQAVNDGVMGGVSDGRFDATERAEVTRIAESLSQGSDINVAAMYQDVLLKRVSLDGATAALTSPETKRLAHELCVGAGLLHAGAPNQRAQPYDLAASGGPLVYLG